jgi:iron-sulfur cluster repair protein YtfE (RIC family)
MIHSLFAQYRNYNLKELAARFYKEYYTTMEELCNNAGREADKLHAKGKDATEYLLQYHKLAAEVREYILYRKDILFPYLEELSDKTREGHDCTNCKGGCKAAHMAKVMDLNISHSRIQGTLDEIKTVSLLRSDEMNEREWKVLQNELQLLEGMLTELYYLEQEVLLPRIKKAQHNINAYS